MPCPTGPAVADWREVGPVRRRASVTLDGSGNGAVTFDVWSANHKWILDTVVVNVTGATPILFPQCTLSVGGQNQSGLSEGATWAGNQETFRGSIEMGNADTLLVTFTGGSPGAVATAIVEGTNYLWR